MSLRQSGGVIITHHTGLGRYFMFPVFLSCDVLSCVCALKTHYAEKTWRKTCCSTHYPQQEKSTCAKISHTWITSNRARRAACCACGLSKQRIDTFTWADCAQIARLKCPALIPPQFLPSCSCLRSAFRLIICAAAFCNTRRLHLHGTRLQHAWDVPGPQTPAQASPCARGAGRA